MGDEAALEPLGLHEELVGVVRDQLGFTNWTPVQRATIPAFLGHCDVAVEACTGSGKTLAFLLPVFQMIVREKLDGLEPKALSKGIKAAIAKHRPTQPGHWGAVVISPTRELAQQTFRVAQPFADAIGLRTQLLTGGSSVADDVEDVSHEALDVVIGTPGRLEDVMSRAQESLRYRDLQALVLDEADVLLNMGFERSVTAILGRLPRQRRTGLFSATQTKEVRALIRAGLRNPAVISVQVERKQKEQDKQKQQMTPLALDNAYLVCEQDAKLQVLCRLLKQKREEKLVVFFSTCAAVEFFDAALQILFHGEEGCEVVAMHGRMPQKKRFRTYDAFVAQSRGALLCTDVAARGVDIPAVDWIVQFDPPQDPSFFVHRVGRTARAGRAGRALLFLLPKETAYVNLLEKRKVPLREYEDSEALTAEGGGFEDALERVKAGVWKDRALLEKGTRAFISFVRSYKEHQCQFIFRVADLDMARVARSFVLLRTPTISELRETRGIKGFEEAPADAVNAIPFRDKHREKQRKERHERLKAELAAQKQERYKKRQAESREAEQPKKRRNTSRSKKLKAEWDELAREEHLYKQMKKGKLSKADYEAALFGR